MEVELYTPHQKQRKIHQSINEEPYKYYTLNIGRQFGKSILAQNQAVDWMCNKGWSGAWVSPIYKQAKKVSEEMFNAFPDLFTYNRSDLIMKTPNGGQLQFFSSEKYDNLRGFTFDFLIMDEAAHQAEEAWTEVLRATVLVNGKKVLFVSTPNGKNWFYRMHQLGLSEEKYKSFTFTSYDNPLIDPEEIDAAQRTLPDHIFKQEYLAEFLDGGASVFINVEDCVRESQKKGKCFAGVDLGRADDWTVLTIVNEDNEELYCERWRHMEWSKIINNIVEQLLKYQPYTLVESNGAQDAIYEQIRNKYSSSKCLPFVTTSKSKVSIVEDLIVEFENMDLGIMGHDWQIGELQSFTYEYNVKTRQIKYSAPVGLHDDYVMSRAITSHAKKTMKSSGKYSVY